MTVFNPRIFSDQTRGASITEVLLAMAIVALATPLVYNKIAQTNHTIRDIASARRIINTRDNVLNFVRMKQDQWPATAQIRLDESELDVISVDAVAGLIDKYSVNGATVTDVYLVFGMDGDEIRTNKIARHIGGDAAVVGADLVAYGNTWAVTAPDFAPGDLVYRISRDVAGVDTSRYLHRATSGEDKLNVMERNLDMAYHHVYNVATADAKSVYAKNGNTSFVTTNAASSGTMYFASGAKIDGADVLINDLRVSGDMLGFRDVYANSINGNKYTTSGRIIADKATVLGSINVSSDLVIKSDSSRTISGFTGISASSVSVPFISAEEIIFRDDFGLTISGELLMSTTPPLWVGDWAFQSTKPPAFKRFNLSRADVPSAPSRNAFSPLISSGWMGATQTIISTID
ncbi:MAG: hypothetical protein R8N50_01350 [Alphaproteobacteria bacterium]|nr:hypothetical protein [Alphaproteobacteria bacterium]